MQKLVLIDVADMKTVEKIQIFPQYRLIPIVLAQEWNRRGTYRAWPKITH